LLHITQRFANYLPHVVRRAEESSHQQMHRLRGPTWHIYTIRCRDLVA